LANTCAVKQDHDQASKWTVTKCKNAFTSTAQWLYAILALCILRRRVNGEVSRPRVLLYNSLLKKEHSRKQRRDMAFKGRSRPLEFRCHPLGILVMHFLNEPLRSISIYEERGLGWEAIQRAKIATEGAVSQLRKLFTAETLRTFYSLFLNWIFESLFQEVSVNLNAFLFAEETFGFDQCVAECGINFPKSVCRNLSRIPTEGIRSPFQLEMPAVVVKYYTGQNKRWANAGNTD